MTHITEGALQAYLDGELHVEGRAGVERHLSLCASCTTELELLRQAAEIFGRAVAELDVPASGVPVVNAPAPRVIEFAARARRESGWKVSGLVMGAPAALLRAAVVVLLVGGVAWGALPGSPLRGWVGQLWREGAALLDGARGTAPTGVTSSSPEQVTAGVSVLPVGGESRILLREVAAETQLRVRPVERNQVTVQWTGSGADPHFRTAPGRIEVLGGGSGGILVEAPRGSRTLIEVDGRLIAIVEGDMVRPLIEAAEIGEDVVFSALSRRE